MKDTNKWKLRQDGKCPCIFLLVYLKFYLDGGNKFSLCDVIFCFLRSFYCHRFAIIYHIIFLCGEAITVFSFCPFVLSYMQYISTISNFIIRILDFQENLAYIIWAIKHDSLNKIERFNFCFSFSPCPFSFQISFPSSSLLFFMQFFLSI